MSCQINGEVPGGVYLCQIRENISCGACCGLYNVADASQEALVSMLTCRTETFARVSRTMDAILAFRQEIEDREVQTRPYPQFHHCPYIGWVGQKRSRVGCLLHPLAQGNHGVDFRGLSYYGGMACRVYFCPAYHRLPAVPKEIIREVSTDWYRYGLIITETAMLTAFFEELERRLGRKLSRDDIVANEKAAEVLTQFLDLKLNWPFRPRPIVGWANYFFEDRLYVNPPINYESLGHPASKYDILLRELNSSIDSVATLHKAERVLERILGRLTEALG
ncbi:MAG: hypothetical protein JSW39_08500 [Desulfobacterales bacterium]|nr:MAG: hypothetical protein JSW39_08500 [Desulfobacterales bacterium]